MLEYQNGLVAINKLINSLRIAVEEGEGSLDKEMTSYSDIFDAFRLSSMFHGP
ncbi:MAG: hypothetical protein WA941_10580 [Nitrososphaeraceae archaeon]